MLGSYFDVFSSALAAAARVIFSTWKSADHFSYEMRLLDETREWMDDHSVMIRA